jgi:copper chaperone CopZ
MVEQGTESANFLYEFHVGMTCEGCSNAIRKLLGTEAYVRSFELSIPDKSLKLVGPDGIEDQVMARLTKWATASKKELAFTSKNEIAAAQ